MGLKEILEEINQDGAQETAAILSEARVKAGQALLKKQEELDNLYQKRRDNLAEETERLRRKLLAKAELEEQRQRFRAIHEHVENLLQQALSSIKEYFGSHPDRYTEYLSGIIKHATRELHSKTLEVSFNQQDAGLFDKISKKSGVSITLGEIVPIQGGVICRKDREIIDHSLEAMFEHMRPGFVRIITDELHQD